MKTITALPAAAPETPRTICLRADEVLNLGRPHRGAWIEVQRGVVWLTGAPAQGDVLLRAGDRFEVNTTDLYVLQALGGPAMCRGRT